MSNTTDVLARMIAARKAKIASVTKTASPGDGVDNGAAPTVTGPRVAENAVHASTPSDAMVEAGAKDNKAGDSLSNSASSMELGAAAVDGQSGAKGAVTGEVGKLAPGSTEKIASDLRAMAKAIESEREAKIASMDAIDKFFLKTIKSDDTLKVAAEGMEDPAAAESAIQQLVQQLESGQIDDKQAEQILNEMVQAGAIKPEEVEAIKQQLAQQGGEQGAPAEAGLPPEAGMPPEAAMAPPMDAGAVAPSMDAPVEDPSLEAKLASVDVGPEHAQYGEKLEALYPTEVAQGEHYCLKIAQHLGFLAPKVASVYSDADIAAAAKALDVNPEEAKALMSGSTPKIASAADAVKVELLTRLALRA